MTRVCPALVAALTLFAGVACAEEKPPLLKVGIIGLDTSHVTAFTGLINKDNKGPLENIRVVAAFPGGSPDLDISAKRLAGFRRREVLARHRDGKVGAQAQLAPVRVGGKKHAPPDVLAREIEERLGRLKNGGRDARIARALIMRDQRLRPCVGRSHGSGFVMSRMARRRSFQYVGRAFNMLQLRFRLRSPGAINGRRLLA